MAKKTAYYGCMTAIAMICGYIEALIPFNFGIPGIKLGLANVAAVYLLYRNGAAPAFAVNTARILLCGILFGNAASVFYSLCGGTLSLTVMILAKRTGIFSVVGVSAAGAAAHNMGQLAAAALVIGAGPVIGYFPILNIAGTVAGVLIGVASHYIIKRTRAVT